jgi:redox-sensing transcriptional repressor
MVKKGKGVSGALLRRLPSYFRVLIKIYAEGSEITSSEELAARMSLTPSQVRADMKAIGCTGQRSYGYVVSRLYKTVADILQLSDKYSAVIIGNAPIASAVAQTQVFSKRGIKLVGFLKEDFSEEKIVELCNEKHPDIIIIASDTDEADGILKAAEPLRDLISEVWNFTEAELSSEALKVKNYHISDYIMMLCSEMEKRC